MVGRFAAQVQQARTEILHSPDHLLVADPNIAFLRLLMITKAVAIVRHLRAIVDDIQTGLHGRIQHVHILFLNEWTKSDAFFLKDEP